MSKITIAVFKAGKGEKKAIRDFLKIPSYIYGKDENTADTEAEKQLLTGNHILSHYFDFYGIVLYKDNKPTARCSVTMYHGENDAYFGHFECPDNSKVAELLLSTAERLCKKYGKNRLTGPVDGSFWIKYRLKTGDNFGSPYTSEPYNKAYYERLILSCGYGVYEKYGSNHYIVPYEDDPRLTRCLERVVKKGYIIKSPQKEDFFKALEEIYEMVIRLYSGFPVFKAITKEEFFSIYEKLEKIVDFDMVKLAYYENEPVGFFVAIPDFGRMVSGKINPLDIPKILKIKKSPKCYILLYLGAQSSHRGLGMALAESMRSSLRDKNAQSVGALIREKNLKRSYMDIYTDKSYSYCLYSKEI